MELKQADIKVEVTVMGQRFALTGIADISDGINTDAGRGAIELDGKLIMQKINQELAAKLREAADKLEQES